MTIGMGSKTGAGFTAFKNDCIGMGSKTGAGFTAFKDDCWYG